MRLPDPVSHPDMLQALETFVIRELGNGQTFDTSTNRHLKREMAKIADLPRTKVEHWLEKRIHVDYKEKSVVLFTDPPNWDELDELMPISNDDTASRYTADYDWKDNSCAVDVLVALAIQLDAWRVRADQSLGLRPHNLAVHWLRNVASSAWGLMNSTQRTALRDQLQKTLAILSTDYKKVNEYRSCIETYENLFAQLPQVSSITFRLSWCCDENYRHLDRFKERILHTVDKATAAKKPTIKSLFESVFATRQESMCCGVPCHTNGTTSCGKMTSRMAILGRLSPIIVIDALTAACDSIDTQDPGIIAVEYLSLGREDLAAGPPYAPIRCTAKYRLEAVIYNTGSHYVLESSLRGNRLHIDMLKEQGSRFGRSRCVPGNWKYDDATVAMMVFKRLADSKGEIGKATPPGTEV